MKFDDLDAKMRVFETAHDLCALPGLCLVARIDGRNFTRLTKELVKFEAPQGRIVPFLHGGAERIHVQMEDDTKHRPGRFSESVRIKKSC